MAFFEFPHTRTYDSDLGWLIKNVKSNQEAIQVLEQFKLDSEEAFEQLRRLLEDVANGNFPPEISNAIKNYITKNFYNIVGEMIKFVWFGLTDSGYFVAYIPQSWQDVIFKTTGLDINLELQPEYGHLVLQANYITNKGVL